MPCAKPSCPACGAFALRCTKTMPDESEPMHYVEMPRVSTWVCTACGARYLLTTPAGKLRKVRKVHA